MQRGTSVALGALVVLAAAIVVVKGGRPGDAASVRAAPSAARAEPARDGGEALSAGHEGPADAGTLPIADLVTTDAAPPNGDALVLPSGAPKQVRFGVVLVQYKGAQGASAAARTKDEARALAEQLAEAAKSDFKSAVGRGDSGSTEDAGRIPRGVLEPSVEYALFTLDKGSVSAPLDTPRGFWIVRRAD